MRFEWSGTQVSICGTLLPWQCSTRASLGHSAARGLRNPQLTDATAIPLHEEELRLRHCLLSSLGPSLTKTCFNYVINHRAWTMFEHTHEQMRLAD